MSFFHQKFLAIGFTTFIGLGMYANTSKVLAQENVSSIHYQSTDNHLLDTSDKVSSLSEQNQQKLFQSLNSIEQNEIQVAFSKGLYPNIQKHFTDLHIQYTNETKGSVAIKEQVWHGFHQDVACKIILAVNNQKGIPSLDMDEVAQHFNVSLNPNLSRLFVTFHEMAHCEANFAGKKGYHYQSITSSQAVLFDKALKQQSVVIGKHPLSEYFDETFADAYAFLALMKVTNFDKKTEIFLQNMATIRQEVADIQTEARGALYDPHGSEKGMTVLAQMAQDEQFKTLLMNDNDGSFIYELATTIASTHLNEIIASEDFEKVLKTKGSVDKVSEEVFNTVKEHIVFQEYKPLTAEMEMVAQKSTLEYDATLDDADNGLDLSNFKTATHQVIENLTHLSKISSNIEKIRQQSLANKSESDFKL